MTFLPGIHSTYCHLNCFSLAYPGAEAGRGNFGLWFANLYTSQRFSTFRGRRSESDGETSPYNQEILEVSIPIKEMDSTEIFVHSLSSVFISFEEETDGSKFFVAFIPSATEKLSGTFC